MHDVQTIVYLAKLRPWVIRGNASEIMALAGAAGTTRGVDSTAESSEAVELGKQLALDLRTIVAISGKVDYVGFPSGLPRLTWCSKSPMHSCRMALTSMSCSSLYEVQIE